MPQRRTSLKELRKNRARHLHHQDIKTNLKKTIKKFLSAVTAKNKTQAQADLRIVFKKLDKASKRHLLHKNTVARRKSLYSRLVASLN